MKRISVLIILPVLLFALEKVNLIKDNGFEKDSDVWHTNVEGTTFPNIAATVNKHDSENYYLGCFSGSGDTRTSPGSTVPNDYELALITQGFSGGKVLLDVDSLIIQFSVFPLWRDFSRCYFARVMLHLNAQKVDYWKVGYLLKRPDMGGMPPPHYAYLRQINFPEDTLWFDYSWNIYLDITDWVSVYPIPLDASLDSIILESGGGYAPWCGQKVFFDDVRLMGYADYDVGVKEITSVTETIPYTPAALIKNFGREPAEFSVVAEILQGETQVYKDSIDWSLPADTEDTIPFSEFIPPDTGAYLLRIYTVMEPDESDADDEQTRELHFEAIAEPPVTHPVTHLSLNVDPFSMSGVLRVSYSLPKGHSGALTLFDLSGRRVDAKQVRGYGSATFSPEVAAGVYIVRLEAGGTTLSRKVVVVE